jgi:hypothetical protein
MKLDLQNIYFSFADGLIDYKCAECTAFCCKGFGLLLSVRRDLPLMNKHYPSVTALALWRDGDQLFLNTPATGCTLLEGTSCGVEKEFGKDRKPAGCTLFPFNNLFSVGKTLIVAIHHICPLRLVVPPRPGDVQGTHSVIAATIRDLGICAEKQMPSWVSELKLPRGDSETSWLKREESFRNRCGDGLRRDRFSDVLEESSGDAKALRGFYRRVGALMGWKGKTRKQRDDIDDLLLALAPTLRILESNRDPEHQLRMLGLLEAQTRYFFSLSSDPIELKGIYGLFMQRRNVLRFLAHGDERLKPVEETPAGLSVPQNLIAQVAAIRRIPKEGVLPGLERAFHRVKHASDRATILNNIVAIGWT